MKDHIGNRLSRRQALQVAGLAGGGLAAGLSLTNAGRIAAQQGPLTFPQQVAGLTRLADDVWVWTYGGYNSLIITSDDGALVTEPSSQFNRNASSLLKAVVASLSPQPVKYVVYSHDHADHNTGGDVFADTAEFVSHDLAKPKIAARNDPRSPVPTITFAQHLTLDLGGKQVDLHYTGRNHSDNSIVLHYGARRLLFAVDFIENKRLPFRDFPDAYPEEWVASLEQIDTTLDFDILVPGHTPPTGKQNVRDQRDYLVALMDTIRAAQAGGLAPNSPEMIAFVRAELAPKYSDWGGFDTVLPLNIEGILRIWSSR